MSFKDRLLSVLNEKDMRPTDLARRIDVPRMTVYKWFGSENKKPTKPNGENLLKTADALMVHSEWLLKGKGPKKLSEEIVWAGHEHSRYAVRIVNIKFTDGARKFSTVPTGDNMATIFLSAELYEKNNYDLDKLFAIKVRGEAMAPSLYDGDLIIVDSADITPKNGIVFAIHEEGEMVIRRLLKIGNQWVISSDNLDKSIYIDKPMTKKNLILGRVVHKQSNRI